jgi:hypothetical protein
MGTVTVNGRVFSGNNLTIVNGRVIIDGVDQSPYSKTINIAVNGNIEKLEVDACSKIGVIGDVGNIKTQSGDVEVRGTVKGSVQTMSGDVECQQILGSVSTMSGDIIN